MVISAPVLLTNEHGINQFNSGVESLNYWLKKRALKNQSTGASRTFVACQSKQVVAYYALASSAITVTETFGRFSRNMPNPVPVVVLGRLAVDRSVQGKGVGRALVQDACYRIINAADLIGIRGMVVHALSHEAKRFYNHLGFESSPLNEMTLMVTLQDLKAAVLSGEV